MIVKDDRIQMANPQFLNTFRQTIVRDSKLTSEHKEIDRILKCDSGEAPCNPFKKLYKNIKSKMRSSPIDSSDFVIERNEVQEKLMSSKVFKIFKKLDDSEANQTKSQHNQISLIALKNPEREEKSQKTSLLSLDQILKINQRQLDQMIFKIEGIQKADG